MKIRRFLIGCALLAPLFASAGCANRKPEAIDFSEVLARAVYDISLRERVLFSGTGMIVVDGHDGSREEYSASGSVVFEPSRGAWFFGNQMTSEMFSGRSNRLIANDASIRELLRRMSVVHGELIHVGGRNRHQYRLDVRLQNGVASGSIVEGRLAVDARSFMPTALSWTMRDVAVPAGRLSGSLGMKIDVEHATFVATGTGSAMTLGDNRIFDMILKNSPLPPSGGFVDTVVQ